MQIILLSSQTIKRTVLGFILILSILTALPYIPVVVRSWHGVSRGVTLEGKPVGGLYRHEIKQRVMELARDIRRAPRNAGYFQETGELIPEKDGLEVDVAGTVRAVMNAKPGARLRLHTYRVTAALDRSYYQPIYEGNPTRNQVSLTFNVAWGEEEIPRILEILRETRTHATFYFVGTWVEKFPELVQAIFAGGHEIANHGLYHGHPAQMGRDALVRLIDENQRLLKRTIGREPAKLFAPPYGEFDQDVLSVAGDLHYRTILWTLDTVDWKRPAPEVIRERVRSKIRPGAIVLMHPTAPTTAALRWVIEDLRAKGLKPVPVSQLIRK